MQKGTDIGRREFIGAGLASLAAGNLLAKPAEDEVKFCAFADIHYYPGVFPHDTREWLERVLNRAEKSKVDFIIHMGDFTHTPVKCRDYVDFYNDFRIKTYHTIGNHDDDGNSHEETLAAYRLSRGYYHFDRGGFRFIVTDTNNCLVDGKWVHYSNGNYYAVGRKSGRLKRPLLKNSCAVPAFCSILSVECGSSGTACGRLRQFHKERYRSGHNGADSKSVCGQQPHVGSNPTRSAKEKQSPNGWLLLFGLYVQWDSNPERC